jgi:hypothetical protein
MNCPKLEFLLVNLIQPKTILFKNLFKRQGGKFTPLTERLDS